jgi:drug/metabolite transporter (DMT)-like permease
MKATDKSISSKKILILVTLSMISFSANSILCRLALSSYLIDAASFTLVRLVSGAIALIGIHYLYTKQLMLGGSWREALMLFIYVASFSLAYANISASNGALILFGTVQVTMVLHGLLRGERLYWTQWIGFFIALIGLFCLLSPGITAPSLVSSCLMIIAGIAWGHYSLFGRGSVNPIRDTAGNFILSIPFAVMFYVISIKNNIQLINLGTIYAFVSGAITSGVGYAMWYAALPYLSTIQSSSVQLSVPIITAVAGALFMSETLSTRLFLTSIMILGGITMVLTKKSLS